MVVADDSVVVDSRMTVITGHAFKSRFTSLIRCDGTGLSFQFTERRVATRAKCLNFAGGVSEKLSAPWHQTLDFWRHTRAWTDSILHTVADDSLCTPAQIERKSLLRDPFRQLGLVTSKKKKANHSFSAIVKR